MATKAIFRKEGKSIDVHPSDDIKCGDIKIVGGCPCIALWDVPANTDGTLKVLHRGDVIELTTETAIGETTLGVAIYLGADGKVTKTGENNTLLGFTDKAVAAGALTFTIVCV